MKIINLGGATGILEHNGKRMLFDPWLDDGIFHGAWFHYPPVILPKDGIKGLGRFDYVYISHIHEDHCSLGTLKELNDDAELIIMDRTPNFVLQFIKRNNLPFKKIHLIPPWVKTKINDDLEVSMVTTDPAHELNFQIDSGIIIKWGDKVVYNSNDCSPYKGSIDYINQNYGSIDLALLPYATGSSFPSCFVNLSHDEKMSEKERLFKFGMKKFAETADQIQAKFVMPFADQYVIAGNKYQLNKYMPHPSSPGVLRDHYKDSDTQKLLLLNSGQSFDVKTLLKSPDEEFIYHSESDKEKYAETISDVKYDHEKFEFSKSINLSKLMMLAGQQYFEKLKKQGISSATKFVIEVTDWKKKYVIDNQLYNIEEVDFSAKDEMPMLKVSVEAGLLTLLLIGHTSWNIADAALFIEYTRLPNTYDPKVHSLWNYLKI